MIKADAISLSHSGFARPVLSDVSFRVEQGEIAMLLGPNGSGKTSLLRCVCGLWRASGGRIFVDGQSLDDLAAGERAKRIAIVPQKFFSPFGFSVENLVLMGRAPHIGPFGSPGARDRALAHEAMRLVGVAALGQRDITRISGGELQLALLARALVQEAPILLLDEPTAHLDLAHQIVVMQTVQQAARERGLTVLMSVHDPNLALDFADRALMLKSGRIVGDGKPADKINARAIADVYGVDADIVDLGARRIVAPRALRREPGLEP